LSAKKLNIGIAGFGIVGRRRRDFVDLHAGMKTVAVCDRSFEGNGILADGVRHFDNYRSMIDNEALDALFVCMTNDVAPEATITGLEKGLHVFCEKPPGKEVDDIRRVRVVESENPNLRLMYGFNHRHHESVQDALRIVNSGELGNVINIKGTYGKSKIVTFNQNDWRTKRILAGGGVLLDQGIHMVDLMRLFAGEFVEFHSFISNTYWNHDIEDNAYALMRTKDGVVGMLHSSATQWRHRFSLEVALERGSLILGGILSSSKSYGAETLSVVYADPDNDYGDPKEHRTKYNNDPSWAAEIDMFSKAILSGAPISHGSSEDALKTMQCVYDIYCADSDWRERYKLKN
jgi:predicted dehydrogenase